MKNISMRDSFFNSLYKIAKKDRNLIIISADMGAPGLDQFRENLKEQFINVGIAEQGMATLAAGLALSGKKVYMYAIMPFVTLRCYEMLKVDASLMKLPIIAVGVGAGFSYDDSGPTHHATEDVSIMRALPDMTILNSSDSVMAGKFAGISYNEKGPCYVRLDRGLQPVIYNDKEDFKSGIKVLKEGREVVIIATGNMVHRALEISKDLAGKNVKAGVIDLYRLKPVNEKLLLDKIKGAKLAVTLEEHMLIGGLGSAVAELLADNNRLIPLKRIGIKDRYYYVYGGRENIQAVCGLDADSVVKKILEKV